MGLYNISFQDSPSIYLYLVNTNLNSSTPTYFYKLDSFALFDPAFSRQP